MPIICFRCIRIFSSRSSPPRSFRRVYRVGVAVSFLENDVNSSFHRNTGVSSDNKIPLKSTAPGIAIRVARRNNLISDRTTRVEFAGAK